MGRWQVVSKGLTYQASLGRLPTRAKSPYTVLNEAHCAYHPDDLSNTSPSQDCIPETAPLWERRAKHIPSAGEA